MAFNAFNVKNLGQSFSNFLNDAYNSLFPAAANRKMAQNEMTFNANEAQKQRDFDNALNIQQFSQNSMLQNQQFQNQLFLDNMARDWQSNANQLAMDFEKQQAEAQMAFQKDLVTNAHQYQMADLKAAGLNPILAASLGGSSVSNGASGSGFSSSPSMGSASSASVGLPSTSSSARMHGVSNNKSLFDNISDLVGDYMHNARAIAKAVKTFNKDIKKIANNDYYKDTVKDAAVANALKVLSKLS